MSRDNDKKTNWHWSGVNRYGEKMNGVFETGSREVARLSLQKQGILIRKMVRKGRLSARKRIRPRDIALFARQLATMMQAGIPLLQSFDIILKDQNRERMHTLIGSIKLDVESGLMLSEALGKHPLYFNQLFCNLVDSGEKSGSLDIMLERIATWKEKMESLKGTIKKTLTYPLAVLILALVVTTLMLVFVVPQFETLLTESGAELPLLTQLVIRLSRFFQADWTVIFGGMAAAIFSWKHALKRSLRVQQFKDRVILTLPLIGRTIKKTIIARFSRTLSITLAAGLPLIEALTTTANASGNSLYRKAIHQIREDVSRGQPMHTAMGKTRLFPCVVTQMITIGEESGTLERMLGKVADWYEEEVDNDMDSFTSLLEPVIMSVLGILVGGLVIAMYIPIFNRGFAL